MLKGFKYPLELDSQGGLLLATDLEYLGSQIVSYLETEQRERLGLPRYGLRDYLFKSVSALPAIATEIAVGLRTYIPQCRFEVSATVSDAGEIFVKVDWDYQGEAAVTEVRF